ncbi:hypothetical protein [Streptomyces sp. NBC_01240]|uniref:hypothetical protein n=1 Tax=Streptomyces sp. NBC_01240 TaxID=2903793 RepID=UPI002E13C748|nr:hypothetical protein OG466_41155 [Streptomyces sp. NBC_01240]
MRTTTMATRQQLLDDYDHFTNQTFRNLEKLHDLTPDQELQVAQIKATLALAAATAATVAPG